MRWPVSAIITAITGTVPVMCGVDNWRVM